MAEGHTVRINEAGKDRENWHVALSDPDVSMMAARRAAGCPAHAPARIVRELNGADLSRMGLVAGQTRKA
jgi:hypothetical protein